MASAIWFTDRSRYETGTGKCAFRRYLTNHAGPTGYGWVRKGESLPLATGTAFHTGLGMLTEILRTTDKLPSENEVRAIIRVCRDDYETLLTEKGYSSGGLFSSAITEETIKEQSSLIHGLIWTIAVRFLPWLHDTYRVLEVEQERLHFLQCTCGAGPMEQAEHDARGCHGVALMLRTDCLAQHRQGQHLAYFEGKTTGWESDAWAEQWEIKPQLGLGTLDLDTRYGHEVSELFIIGVNKGSRKKDRNDEGTPFEGMRRQQSPLCYGYCRPGNPPLAKDDWHPAYEWTTDAGEVKRTTKAHKKRGVWQLAASDWPLYKAYTSDGGNVPPEEFWVRTLPKPVLDKIVFLLGPMNRQDAQIQALRRGVHGEEVKWQEILWNLYELQQQGHSWGSPAFHERADTLIPRSWQCRQFGKDYQCEFVPLCYQHTGWQDPASIGYTARRPHHAPELTQAVERGLLLAESAEAEEEERG